MKGRIEIEKKYYCTNNKELLKLIKKYKMNLIENSNEIDEYFTDIDSKYIRTRTCLRIRKIKDYMELTYKGKSDELLNSYAKVENNITLNINEYDNVIGLLNSLGYLSYSIVNKNRFTYNIVKDNINYNIMIDSIENIGSFVEFELLYDSNDRNIEELQVLLDNFVENFKSLNFESANLPYRDFVAKENYLNIIPSNNIKIIIVNENIFFGNNDIINNIKLLKRIKEKNIKLVLLSKDNKSLIDKYNLDDLFDEIKEFYEITKNTNDSIFITDSKELIPNIKSIIINKYYNYKTNNYDTLSRILLLLINHI